MSSRWPCSTPDRSRWPTSPTIARWCASNQTLYSGLAFSRDGKHLYASMGSTHRPAGDGKDEKNTGSGVVVYSFADGKIAPERFIHLPLQQLAAGPQDQAHRRSRGRQGRAVSGGHCCGWPGGREKLLVAENLSDDVLLIDAASGAMEHRFDLSESDAVPSTYPVALAVTKDGSRAFVALWNASEIVELDLAKARVGRKLALLKPPSPVAPGTHPCAFEFSPDGRTLYVALANRDAVAAVNVGAGQFAVKGYFDTRLPGQSYFGAEPEALAINAEGSRLYVANAISDAVAVLDTTKLTLKAAKQAWSSPSALCPLSGCPCPWPFFPPPAAASST